jgi:hypothetical protein
MKFRNLHLAYIIVGLFGLLMVTSWAGGKPGASSTGCGGGGCHSQSNATSIFISIDGNSNVTCYTPGKKYVITVTVSNSSFSSNSNAKSGLSLNFSKGSIVAVPANTKVTNQELNHQASIALTSGSKTFSFDWIAPGKGQGAVNIDVSANIVNGDGGTNGDAWAKISKSLTEEPGAAILTSNELAINLYPNPSSDFAIISGNDLTSINEIVAVNMSGRRFSLPIIHTKSGQIRLNTSGLSKGKYFIQIQSGDKTSSLPLLID